MSKDLDKYTDNLAALDQALRDANQGGIMTHMGATVGDFLKLLARSNVDISAKCLRPMEQVDGGAA